jgi:hypothetical protein
VIALKVSGDIQATAVQQSILRPRVSLGELSQIVRLAVDVPELVVVDRLAGSLDLGLGGAVEDDAIEVRILLIPDSSACARNHRAFVHVWVNAPAAGGRHPPQS